VKVGVVQIPDAFSYVVKKIIGDSKKGNLQILSTNILFRPHTRDFHIFDTSIEVHKKSTAND
jgi:hypothetical protein